MKSNSLAILIAYYLSRFDKQGLKNLGFETESSAFDSISKILGVKKNYIKFRRDEFDPVHPWRKGWQRPMANRIVRTIQAFQDMNESELRDIVLNILSDPKYPDSEEGEQIKLVLTQKKRSLQNRNFILRGPTGKLAEEFYIKHFSENHFPAKGSLIDCRDLGVGYDFRIEAEDAIYFVEVKGLLDISGGVLFTNKEWLTASEKNESYFLCIVSNIGEVPGIRFIQNPTAKINPKRNISTVIQINWSISENELIKAVLI
jgi:hypothetical protein